MTSTTSMPIRCSPALVSKSGHSSPRVGTSMICPSARIAPMNLVNMASSRSSFTSGRGSTTIRVPLPPPPKTIFARGLLGLRGGSLAIEGFTLVDLCDELTDDSLYELRGSFLGSTESPFQGVAEFHQVLNLCDDALLLLVGRHGDDQRFHIAHPEMLHRRTYGRASHP